MTTDIGIEWPERYDPGLDQLSKMLIDNDYNALLDSDIYPSSSILQIMHI